MSETIQANQATQTNQVNQKENAAALTALVYKGKPLVRKGNVICFGDAKTDDYIMMLEIRSPNNILIAIQSTDAESREVVKFGEKESLYDAFEIGEIWLESFLK